MIVSNPSQVLTYSRKRSLRINYLEALTAPWKLKVPFIGERFPSSLKRDLALLAKGRNLRAILIFFFFFKSDFFLKGIDFDNFW
uniref:Uncharacterized protein n=1 Tax=Athene cunicularia TaxID=194338 RepID=A0A663MBS7_ATHCN